MIEKGYHSITDRRKLTSLNERQSLIELWVICGTAGELRKQTFQPCDLTPTYWKQSQEVRTTASQNLKILNIGTLLYVRYIAAASVTHLNAALVCRLYCQTMHCSGNLHNEGNICVTAHIPWCTLTTTHHLPYTCLALVHTHIQQSQYFTSVNRTVK